MIGYETEEQQVQAIKQFWKDNGIAIVAGAVIGLGLLLGWRYYNDSKISSQEAASTGFQAGLESIGDNNNTEKLQAFVKDNAETAYAPLASMILAQQAVDKGDLDAAVSALKSAISNDKIISDIARLRLANLHLQLGQSEQALSTLNEISSPSFDAQVAELKGDALAAKGDFDAAKDAYTSALAQTPSNSLLQIKRDNIAYAKTQNLGGDVE